MKRPRPRERTVFVVDDDEAVRDALTMLFRAEGLRVAAYASAAAFLQQQARPAPPACLVLDIRMPGMTGLELQERLAERGVRLPIVFVTGHGDVPMAVAAVKKGAFEFLEKPFDDQVLLERVRQALEMPAGPPPVAPRERARLARLSVRERQVLELVLAGTPSRDIAARLSISLKTVEFHRARILDKLEVRSAAELFRLCLAA